MQRMHRPKKEKKMKKLIFMVSSLTVLTLLLGCSQGGSDRTAAEQTTEKEPVTDGSILPFPEPPSASVAGKTLKESKHQWRKTPNRLPKDAPNIVIFMTDDAGFANPPLAALSICRLLNVWQKRESVTMSFTPRPCARLQGRHS